MTNTDFTNIALYITENPNTVKTFTHKGMVYEDPQGNIFTSTIDQIEQYIFYAGDQYVRTLCIDKNGKPYMTIEMI